MRKILAITGLAMLLSGCGEKGDFEKAINAKISHSKLCYSLQDNDIVFNKGFPIRVNHGYRSAGYSASDEILKGLANHRKDGACVGHRAVAEIKEWTEPGNGNQKVVRVSYTWKLADVPSWVDKKVFSSVKGMNEPEESMINLVKTSNGWKAI